jgi:NAD-dependent deacetylase
VTTPEHRSLDENLTQAAKALSQSPKNVALTGAGISVESGIPDFRSTGGLWERYDIREYGTISAFRSNPEKVWKMFAEMEDVVRKARPNAAHKALGRLEQLGLLDAVITQNIDNLHQEGGTTNVVEFHGNSKILTCLWCNLEYGLDQRVDNRLPRCRCGKPLKPNVVLFGEAIPQQALYESFQLAADCQTLLVIGTSAQVAPASAIPHTAKKAGATIIEINLEPTLLTVSVTDIFLQGQAGKLVPALVKKSEGLGNHPSA